MTAVYTLLVICGRGPDDDLPDRATGAALLCYAAAGDEPTAVRETVETLRTAGFAPLDVQAYGTREEQEAQGRRFDGAERALMQRALDENAVIVAKADPLYEHDYDDHDDDGDSDGGDGE